MQAGNGIYPGCPCPRAMKPQDITLEDLERFAAAMANAIPDLDCPECCDQGWRYQYMEKSAALHQDEWEWHCLAIAIARRRNRQ